MELLQLRYFLVAAQYQHITKAAEHLRIAQPALSQSIHRLEAELGVPLFTRQNRSIELNEEGRFLQQRLIPILHSLDQIPEELQKGKYQMNHTIHLRLLSASSLITSRIIAYRSLHPEVSFQLYQNPDQDDNFDLCVSARRADTVSEHSAHNDFADDVMVMLEEELYLAVPTHSDFGQKTTIRLSETRDADYICLAGSRPIRQITNSYFDEEGFSPHIVFESDTTESVRNLIAAGRGIGFWPQHSWGTIPEKLADSPEQFPVRLLHIEDRVCRRQITLTRSEKGRNNPVITDFCNFLMCQK